MKNNFYRIKHIEQKDNYTFTIKWSDGKVIDYRLSDLQRRCPCASCVDEVTGERLRDASQVRDDVKAKRIVSVGRYALKIEFTLGCSYGIFTFDMLREGL